MLHLQDSLFFFLLSLLTDVNTKVGGTAMFTLGFDVAKDKVDVALVNRSGQLKDRYIVTNSPKTITDLLKSVRSKHSKLRCGCEATGHYHVALVRAC